MSKRKPISKKLRFEVFKRDSFTCQYCGAKAPDVILHVDHIKPVSKDGDNDILNLVTSCINCNSGKGARTLSDRSEIEKQRAQLEELNERRQQLEWMLQWREGLESLDSHMADAAVAAWDARVVGFEANDHGRANLSKWIKRYGLQDVLSAMDAACDQYLVLEDGGEAHTADSVDHAFKMIPRVAAVRKKMADRPYLKDLFYIRGILRNRLHYVNDHECMDLLERAHLAGASIESLRAFSKDVRNWTGFRDEMTRFLDEHES